VEQKFLTKPFSGAAQLPQTTCFRQNLPWNDRQYRDHLEGHQEMFGANSRAGRNILKKIKILPVTSRHLTNN